MIQASGTEAERAALKASAGSAFRAGDLNGASVVLKRYLCLFPDDGAGYANLLAVLRRAAAPMSGMASLVRYALFAKPESRAPLVALLTSCTELKVPVPEGASPFLAQYATDPDVTRAHAIYLHRLGGADEVSARLRLTLAFHPNATTLYIQHGLVLQEQGCSDAETKFAHAICCADRGSLDFAEAARNLAAIKHASGALAEAVALYRSSLTADPGVPEARANLAAALVDCGDAGAAEAELRRTLVEQPGQRDALWLSSLLRIGAGDRDIGYRYHHVRWTEPHVGARTHSFGTLPLWLGQDPKGRRIFVWGDFGVGDEIVFVPLAAWLAGQGASVVLEIDARLVALAQRSFPSLTVVPRDDAIIDLEDFDFHVPSALLARFHEKDRGREVLPPLRADPERVSVMRDSIALHGTGPKVGLAWGGGGTRTSWSKATDLNDWTALLDTPGVTFFSLQYAGNPVVDRPGVVASKGACAAEWPANLVPAPVEDLRNDLDGLAAFIEALDATVSISGVNAHMAGALRRPGFVLLPRLPLWFWGRTDDTTDWYPSLQLFRRADDGWHKPIADLSDAVRRFLMI